MKTDSMKAAAMTSTPMETGPQRAVAAGGFTGSELAEGFSSFVAAARRLEASHARLAARAEAIDLELARTNERLQRTLDEREAILGALPVGVVALDADGAVGWRNAEAERIEVAAGGIGWTQLGAGESRVAGVALRVQRVPLPTGGQLLVIEDRSRVVSLEQEVERLDRLAGLSELALGVAHEIRNPLHGVAGYASLMERTDDPAQLRRFAGRVREGIAAADEIVAAMLAFARPEGRAAAALRPFGEILEQARIEAGLARTQLVFDGEMAALCDPTVLGRVLVNLLRNAQEACGERPVAVRGSVAREADRLVATLVDDGPGVPEALAARLFDPFVSSKELGSGLGLALSARALAFLGGRIELVDRDLPGARFRIEWPSTAEGGA